MRHTPGPDALPDKVFDTPVARKAKVRVYDRIFFGIGTLGAVWLAVVLVLVPSSLSLSGGIALIAMWVVLAYLALPRLNRILTAIYVPDYFIGRTRTSDGLLGDPLNLAVRGTGEQLATAMVKSGWILADPVTLSSSIGIVRSTLTRRSYPTAPVSPLLLFERSQDAAFQQEVEGNPAQRHHVRFWRTPQGWPLPGGTHVDWLAAGTYDRRVGLSLFTLQITHKIDADIDVERDYIVESLTRAEAEVSVDVLRDFTTSYHSRNGGGDNVHTDGNLPIIDVTRVVPAPDSPDLMSSPPSGVPIQIWLSVIVNLLVVPFVALSAIGSWADHETARGLNIVTLIGSLVIALMSFMMFARSAAARRVLLAVSALVAATHISALTYDAADLNTGHALGAMVAILVLVALSSPRSTEWTAPRP